MQHRLATVFALVVTVPFVAAAQDQNDAVADKVLKLVLKDAAKQHAQAVKALLAPATDVLQEAKAAAASGASAPGDSVDAVANVLTDFDFALANATSSVVLTDVSIDLDTALTAAGLPLPEGALVGTGGLLDKRLASIEKRHQKALAKSRKASRAVLKALEKQGLDGALRTPDTALPAFAPGFFGSGPTPDGGNSGFVLPQLQLTALVGYSEGDQALDGALQISGFTLENETVKLSGRGPLGESFGPLELTPEVDGSFSTTVTGLVEGNWRVQALQAFTLVTDVVGIPGAPDPGTDPTTPQQVDKAAKKAWKDLAKLHSQALEAQGKAFRKKLKLARELVKKGAEPEPVLEGVYAELEEFQQVTEAATNGPEGASGVASAAFGAGLDGLDQLVDEQLVGAGTANDKSSALIEKRVQRETARVLASTRGFAKLLAKKTDWRLSTVVRPIPLRHAAPVKGEELPELAVPLRFEILQGRSRVGVDNDGVISLRIRGDEDLGQRVDIAIFGPNGFVLIDTLASPFLKAGQTLRYPETGPGNLPEGNYVVVLQQQSVLLSATISVPGAETTLN
jgi:hypothetical protein